MRNQDGNDAALIAPIVNAIVGSVFHAIFSGISAYEQKKSGKCSDKKSLPRRAGFFRLSFAAMHIAWMLLFVLLLGTFHSGTADGIPCPFNADECTCTPSASADQFTFADVNCTSANGDLVSFTISPDAKYVVTDSMTITGNVADLPGDYLAAFGSIQKLTLKNAAASFPLQDWAATAI